jgi:hypothetical protein
MATLNAKEIVASIARVLFFMCPPEESTLLSPKEFPSAADWTFVR